MKFNDLWWFRQRRKISKLHGLLSSHMNSSHTEYFFSLFLHILQHQQILSKLICTDLFWPLSPRRSWPQPDFPPRPSGCADIQKWISPWFDSLSTAKMWKWRVVGFFYIFMQPAGAQISGMNEAGNDLENKHVCMMFQESRDGLNWVMFVLITSDVTGKEFLWFYDHSI